MSRDDRRPRDHHRIVTGIGARRPLDRPFLAASFALAIGALVVAAGLARAGGDVSHFVGAATPWAVPGATPEGLTLVADGYDGQFYYRLALDPFTREAAAHGMALDLPAYRQQRIVYPLAAWIVSLGDAARLPVALVLVNLIALALLGWVGGTLARRAGIHSLWGLLLACWPGFAFTLTRDLTELTAAVPLAAGLMLLRAPRPAASAGAFAIAALARETTLPAAAAAGLARLRAEPRRPGAWLPFAAAGALAIGWQVFLAARWQGTATAQGLSALDPPLLGLLAAAWLNADRLPPGELLLWAGLVLFMLAWIGIVTHVLRNATVPGHERMAWYLYVALAALYEANIWANGAVLRAATELAVVGAVIALGAGTRLRAGILALELAALVLVVLFGHLV